jgi:hypothetical protein
MENYTNIYNKLPFIEYQKYCELYTDYNNLSFEGMDRCNIAQLPYLIETPFCHMAEGRWKNALKNREYNLTPAVFALNDWIRRPFPTIHKTGKGEEKTGIALFKKQSGETGALAVTKKIFYRTSLCDLDAIITDQFNQYSVVDGKFPHIIAVRPLLLNRRTTNEISGILGDVSDSPILEIPEQQRKRIMWLSLLYRFQWF